MVMVFMSIMMMMYDVVFVIKFLRIFRTLVRRYSCPSMLAARLSSAVGRYLIVTYCTRRKKLYVRRKVAQNDKTSA